MAHTAPGRTIALIAGVNDAPKAGIGALKSPEADAKRLADLLSTDACGFTVEPLLCGEAATTHALQERLLTLLAELRPDDTLLFSWSGHGIPRTIAGQEHVVLATADFDIQRLHDAGYVCITLAWLRDHILKNRTVGRIILILDCCHAGHIGEYVHIFDAVQKKSFQSDEVRQVLAATDHWTKAPSIGSSSTFMIALQNGLRGEAANPYTGGVTLHDLHLFINRSGKGRYASKLYGYDRAYTFNVATYPEKKIFIRPLQYPSVEEQTTARHLLEQIPTDDLPEPIQQFAPGSRRHDRARNDDFVGREPELRQLATSFKNKETTIISGATTVATGIGGIGKTDLATEFMYRYGRFFAGGVFWLSFADSDQVDAEIAACGGLDALELFSASDKLELEDQVKLVLKVWSQPMPRLIICDNCEDQALLLKYRNKIGASCRILVTSRDHTWNQRSFTRIELNTLQRKESIQLLQHLCSRLSDDEADTIAEALGDFPLALHLAGSYLKTYHHNVVDYLEKLTDLDILNHPSMQGRGADFSPTEHDLHVARTFALSFDRLNPENPIDALAILLLACAAHLAPGEPIPRDFLLAMVPEHIEQDDAVDGLNRARAIGLLDGDTTLIMHRLVHHYVQGGMVSLHDTIQERVWQVIIDQIRAVDDQRSGRDIFGLEPHLRSVATHAHQGETGQSAYVLDRIARFFELQGRYEEAEPLYTRALAIREHTLGSDHPETAISLNNLAGLYESQGRYKEAKPLYTQALAIREHTLGSDHSETATSLNNLAQLYLQQGWYEEAEPFFVRALAIREHTLGSDHSETAQSLNNLAGLYESQGRYEEAEPFFVHALAIYEHTLGSDHPETAISLNNLAGLYCQQGRYEEAKPIRINPPLKGTDFQGVERLREFSCVVQWGVGYAAWFAPFQGWYGTPQENPDSTGSQVPIAEAPVRRASNSGLESPTHR